MVDVQYLGFDFQKRKRVYLAKNRQVALKFAVILPSCSIRIEQRGDVTKTQRI